LPLRPSALPPSVTPYALDLPHPSFPTRRSSDPPPRHPERGVWHPRDNGGLNDPPSPRSVSHMQRAQTACVRRNVEMAGRSGLRRSEEHTSELQSRENLVCRLLLGKKQ